MRVLLAVAALVAAPAAPATPAPAVATVTPWRQHAEPVAWAGGRIYYNQKNASGFFEGWAANPDGSRPVCITCRAHYPLHSHHGIAEASPDGRYALVTVERAGHPQIPLGKKIAAPGNGAFSDLWLQTTDGSHAWQLTSGTESGNALIWPRFDRSGTRVVWSVQWRWGVPFGAWRLYVARLRWSNGAPSLAGVKSTQSSGLLEPYGFTPNGTHVLFAADALAGTKWDDLQIMTIPASLTGRAVRLSPRDASDHGYFTNYNEFAYSMPGSGRIIFGRSVGAFYESMEYWTMNADGTGARQLTWLSQPLSSQYHGYPSLAGPVAFDPADPKRFVAAIETNYDLDYKSVLITLK